MNSVPGVSIVEFEHKWKIINLTYEYEKPFLKVTVNWYDPYGIELITKMSTRSSHQRCSIKKIFLKNFAIFTRKHLCWSLILIKAWRPATLWKRDFLQRYFSVNIAKSLITPILKCICKRMLLDHEIFLLSLRLAPQWHISL